MQTHPVIAYFEKPKMGNANLALGHYKSEKQLELMENDPRIQYQAMRFGYFLHKALFTLDQ